MENTSSNKRTFLMIIGVAILVIGLIGLTYAFFNYTKTGSSNVIKVGRIAFNSNQTNTITLIDVFPIDSSEANTSNQVGTSTITITGDTTYSEGIEYQLTITSLTNTINNKEIPIDVKVFASGIGDNDEDYFINRGGNSSIYKVLGEGTIKNDKQLLAGYITKGNTGVNGSVTIKAYLDKNKIAISDTYPEEDIDTNNDEVIDYTNETTDNWVGDRILLTTEEWNNMRTNGVSFQVKVEANEGIWVEEHLTGVQKVRRSITAKEEQGGTCSDITYEEDGITYLSGSNDCIDMNYVWYSGKLWRITAIYPDGAMKLITENNITSIVFNESEQVNFYTNANTASYMYQWLNEDFYDTLYNPTSFIDTTKRWNATMPENTTISTKPAETNMVSANVGLLNSYEYYNSYRNLGGYSNGFLNIGYYWWLLNPYSATDVWHVYDYGYGVGTYSYNARGGRPSIYLKSGLEFTGVGSRQSPYKIVGDQVTGAPNELINTRMSGEYIKLKNGNSEQVFRIIEAKDNKTKIIAMDYADNKAAKKFSTSSSDALWGSGTTTDTGTWYAYLNAQEIGYFDTLKSTYGDLFDSGTYYLGTSGLNYKLSVCANTTSGNTKVCDKTSQVGTFNIGLSRYGEMFATIESDKNSNSTAIWLINGYSTSKVWYIYNGYAEKNGNPTDMRNVRPTLHLKSTVKILSGSGLPDDPYVVGL